MKQQFQALEIRQQRKMIPEGQEVSVCSTGRGNTIRVSLVGTRVEATVIRTHREELQEEFHRETEFQRSAEIQLSLTLNLIIEPA